MIPFQKIGRLVTAIFIILWTVSFAGAEEGTGVEPTPGFFVDLQSRLFKDGFDPETIRQIYAQPGVSFELKGVSLFFRHSEARLDYDQFLQARRIQMARAYMMEHSDREHGRGGSIVPR